MFITTPEAYSNFAFALTAAVAEAGAKRNDFEPAYLWREKFDCKTLEPRVAQWLLQRNGEERRPSLPLLEPVISGKIKKLNCHWAVAHSLRVSKSKAAGHQFIR